MQVLVGMLASRAAHFQPVKPRSSLARFTVWVPRSHVDIPRLSDPLMSVAQRPAHESCLQRFDVGKTETGPGAEHLNVQTKCDSCAQQPPLMQTQHEGGLVCLPADW